MVKKTLAQLRENKILYETKKNITSENIKQAKRVLSNIKEKGYDSLKKSDKIMSKAGSNLTNKVGKALSSQKKIKPKKVLKKSKSTLTIENKRPAEYVPIYFQAELISTKKNMFFD